MQFLSIQRLLCIFFFVTSVITIPTADSPFDQQFVLTQQPDIRPIPSPSLFAQLRNTLIKIIWKDHKSSAASRGASSRGACPSTLRSRYEDDVVLRFKFNSEEEATAFAEATNLLYLDLWEASHDWADVRISRKVLPSFLTLLPASMQQSYTPVITSLSQVVQDTFPQRTEHGRHHSNNDMPHDLFFENYQPLAVIFPWLRQIASMFPDRTQLFTIGTSYEGRDIPALRIGFVPDQDDPDKDEPRHTIVITAGNHAREWISTSTAAYILRGLVHNSDPVQSSLIAKLLKHYDFIFIPVLNPDGYEYTWTTDRLWRKNRQETTLPFCRGIDLDRSFPFGWDGDTQTDNPCLESYAGEHPLQAIEAQRLVQWAQDAVSNGSRQFAAFVDLHSYSQQILYPYSYTCDRQPHNLEDLQEIAIGLAKAFRLTNGHFYQVDSACEGSFTLTTPATDKTRGEHITTRVEESGGSALDFFYSDLQVKYAFQIKLRDTGTYGFLLPRENIVPTGTETFGAILGLGKWLLGNRGIEGYSDLSGDSIWGQDEIIGNEHSESDKVVVGDDDDDDENDGSWWRRRRR